MFVFGIPIAVGKRVETEAGQQIDPPRVVGFGVGFSASDFKKFAPTTKDPAIQRYLRGEREEAVKPILALVVGGLLVAGGLVARRLRR